MISPSLISIVDDDESVRESLEGLLKSVGFRVEAFASAGDFLNSKALHATDCLILDVRMPGMSGPELQRKLLRSEGFEVETFASAQRFMARARMEPPACLILDVNLPGPSGLDLQQELVDAGIPIPIIFLTGHGSIPMSVRAMKAGAMEFLTKPFNADDLLNAIQEGISGTHSTELETNG